MKEAVYLHLPINYLYYVYFFIHSARKASQNTATQEVRPRDPHRKLWYETCFKLWAAPKPNLETSALFENKFLKLTVSAKHSDPVSGVALQSANSSQTHIHKRYPYFPVSLDFFSPAKEPQKQPWQYRNHLNLPCGQTTTTETRHVVFTLCLSILPQTLKALNCTHQYLSFLAALFFPSVQTEDNVSLYRSQPQWTWPIKLCYNRQFNLKIHVCACLLLFNLRPFF